MVRLLIVFLSAGLLAGCRIADRATSRDLHMPTNSLAQFQAKAAQYHSQLTLPPLETTPEAIRQSVTNAIATANAALDRLGALQPEQADFQHTFVALDHLRYVAGLTANRVGLLKETSTSAAVRDAATEAIKTIEEWAVGIDYREDVYAALKACAARPGKLKGEDAKLLAETLRDYRRAGLELPPAERAEVERLRKELSRLATDYQTHITQAKKPVSFTRAELEGVPENFLDQVKTGDGQYTVLANVTFHYLAVMDNAKPEATRRRLLLAHDTLAMEQNVPLLQKILELRARIAAQLGYATWADYVIEPKMAKTAKNAIDFLERLKTGLQPKFQAELNEFQALKAKETGDPNAQIEVWDWRYFSNQLKKEKYTVDAEALRVYFPYDRVLQGMFAIYERLLRVRLTELEAPYKWIDDLKLFAAADSKTGEPLGLLYLDMFPREGKYNHFAQFGLIEGKRLPDGAYQRPTVALICNFPTPRPGQPSLLSHSDVETLFHEFGHAMHSLLTRANYARFSGTSVPRDFVEAPSQMLENWVWDKRVLDSFAADYRDPAKKIPQEILSQLKAARLATEGTRYRRQISFGLMDLALHTRVRPGVDAVKLSTQVLGDAFLPLPPATAFVAYFGHIVGYDAGYYGYAWADAIAADLATVFEQAPDGYYDQKAGLRLRREIYEPGDSRDVTLSIQKFLGRPQSIAPFLRKVGIGPEPRAVNGADRKMQ